ncbi:hypothetical protein H9Q08_17425 [Chryseobacterium sp. PS-8]|uniref:Novel STAND NTPase 5 domain-containing protein n=1 Tax=Chryseobacterium indicum TaxID=2766954 RepID=A0ABS9C9V3_9FLAO|nr:hypothetical protein [Chryseobacterium sp. PS-8]MCF2221070.1 hypothetical protein [Chryseobacterium sp. PS-8]
MNTHKIEILRSLTLEKFQCEEIEMMTAEKFHDLEEAEKSEVEMVRENLIHVFDKYYVEIYQKFKKDHDTIEFDNKEKERTEKFLFISASENMFSGKDFKKFIKFIGTKDKYFVPGNYIFGDELRTLYPDPRTIYTFLKGGIIKGGTIDFFAICVGYESSNSFDKNYKNPNNVSPAPPVKTKQAEKQPEIHEKKVPSQTISINQNFVKQIKDGKVFTRQQFYTAKQNDNCQWYGVLNSFDIKRGQHDEIKNVLINSFAEQYDLKVSAVVIGDGGTGKSTLLRRLALDLYKQTSFVILWLITESLEGFAKEGLEEIEKNRSQNYLLMIEDWQKLKMDEKNTTLLLEKSNKISNLRICIGDRNNDDALYRHYMHDQDNAIFELTSDENEHIVSEIIKVFSDWKDAASQVFKHKENYKASLFLLLFIMAHKNHSNENSKNKLNLSQPLTAFREIVENDLKKIFKIYPGLGKALYYTAHLYKEYKTPVTYDTFLRFADSFQETSEISKYFSVRNLEGNTTLELVQKYISVKGYLGSGQIEIPDKELVYFNHYIFIEEGFTKIKFNHWEGYGEFIKLQLVKLIIKEKLGEDEILLMDEIIDDRNFVKKYKKELLPYLDTFYSIHIFFWDTTIIKLLKNVELSNNQLEEHTLKILKCYHGKYIDFSKKREEEWLQFVEYYSEKYNEIGKTLVHSYIREYLENFVQWPFLQREDFDHFCFFHNFIASEELLDFFYDRILSHERILEFNSSIVKAVIRISGNQVLVNKRANTILLQSNVPMLNLNFLLPAIEHADYEIVENFAETIFSSPLKNTKEELLVALINKTKNQQFYNLFIDRFLYHKDDIDEESLTDYSLSDFDNSIREILLQNIIRHNHWDKLIPEIVMIAFKESKSNEDKKSFCDKVLINTIWMIQNAEHLFPLYQFSGNKDFENYLFTNWQKVQVHELFEILKEYNNKALPSIIKTYIQEVIQDYHLKGNHTFHYGDLFLLDFSDSVEYKNESEKICNMWEKNKENFTIYNIHVIAKFLCSDYISTIHKKRIAESIFSKWHEEVRSNDILDENIMLYSFSTFFQPYIKECNDRSIKSSCSYYTVYCKRYLLELCILHPIMRDEAEKILDVIRNETEGESLPLSLLFILEIFHDLSWCEEKWSDIKNRIINHIGFDENGYDYYDILFSP